MSTPPRPPEDLRTFTLRALAHKETRVMAVAYLRAAAQKRRERTPATEADRAVAVNFDVLADLCAGANGPYPEVEEDWRDMAKYHPRPLTNMDASIGSPAGMCVEG